MKYPSTFQPVIDLLKSVKDPEDVAEITAVGSAVRLLLAARHPEETHGEPTGLSAMTSRARGSAARSTCLATCAAWPAKQVPAWSSPR